MRSLCGCTVEHDNIITHPALQVSAVSSWRPRVIFREPSDVHEMTYDLGKPRKNNPTVTDPARLIGWVCAVESASGEHCWSARTRVRVNVCADVRA